MVVCKSETVLRGTVCTIARLVLFFSPPQPVKHRVSARAISKTAVNFFMISTSLSKNILIYNTKVPLFGSIPAAPLHSLLLEIHFLQQFTLLLFALKFHEAKEIASCNPCDDTITLKGKSPIAIFYSYIPFIYISYISVGDLMTARIKSRITQDR